MPGLTDDDKARHAEATLVAHRHYLSSRSAEDHAQAWHNALAAARSWISDALRASQWFSRVDVALMANGAHMRVFRHLLTPPKSQDQFKLLCPSWGKTSEAGRPLKAKVAADVAAVFQEWHDKKLTPWLSSSRPPTFREIRRLFDSVAPLMASQEFGTFERKHISSRQEQAVIQLLLDDGWTREPSKTIDLRANLPARHFMHKTRFATSSRPKEVDIACGLKDTYILALECKVTNDATNSIKRINDVLNKATAWKAHWGSFVKPGALLQGVIAPKEVDRLLQAGVEVFWSHDLPTLKRWLNDHL